jgi:Na+/H+ antiporter NhaD/arsenite permease-like protein
MDFNTIVAIIIFIITFYFIITEKIPRSTSAIIGGACMVLFNVITEEEALYAISSNMDILILLMGLMTVVNIMAETGVFQWVAVKIAQLAKGDPIVIMIFLGFISAIASALLDNVTTILLILPVSILIAHQLKINFIPFLFTEIFSVNIGGAATLIGDPPNLIIASKSGLTFNEFIFNMGPIVFLVMIVFLSLMILLFRKDLKVPRIRRVKIMEMDSSRIIKDFTLLKYSIIIFLLIVFGFVTNVFTEIGLSIISIGGSSVLILLAKKNPDDLYKKIEWSTLFFFAGLFVLVDGIEATGLIKDIGDFILDITHGDPKFTVILTILFSSVFAPIIGVVPYTISFTKIIGELIPQMGNNVEPLWWALSMGVCFGGNMTLVGAAANIVGINIAKKAGLEINFMQFFKFGFIITFFSISMSIIYILIRYF